MDICDICGGDKDVGKLAKRLGHRPDVAWAEANKMHRKYESLQAALRKLVEENRPKGRGIFDMTSTEVELAYQQLYLGIDQLLNREGE